jgi:lipid II:glycine glycyltransferase (peptidoglycan interpeptide bridge formation enzyme)
MASQHLRNIDTQTQDEGVRLCHGESDYVAWDRFLEHASGAHYFQTYGWLKSYECFGLTAHVLRYEVNGVIVGGVGFLSAKSPLLPFRIFIVPHGPVPSDPNSPSWMPLMEGLDRLCRDNHTIYTQIYPHALSNETFILTSLKELGYTSPGLFTAHRFSSTPLIIEIAGKNEESVLMSFRNTTRYHIRRASKSDLQIRTEVNQKIFDEIYRLIEENGRLNGYEPRPYSSLRAAWDWFNPKGCATFIQAWRENALAGAVLLLFVGRTAYYLMGATRREFAGQYPSEFMHWHGIREAIKRNMERYDMVNIVSPTVEQFKRGFRPRYESWHEPRTKLYLPRTANLLKCVDRYLRPIIRELARRRAVPMSNHLA